MIDGQVSRPPEMDERAHREKYFRAKYGYALRAVTDKRGLGGSSIWERWGPGISGMTEWRDLEAGRLFEDRWQHSEARPDHQGITTSTGAVLYPRDIAQRKHLMLLRRFGHDYERNALEPNGKHVLNHIESLGLTPVIFDNHCFTVNPSLRDWKIIAKAARHMGILDTQLEQRMREVNHLCDRFQVPGITLKDDEPIWKYCVSWTEAILDAIFLAEYHKIGFSWSMEGWGLRIKPADPPAGQTPQQAKGSGKASASASSSSSPAIRTGAVVKATTLSAPVTEAMASSSRGTAFKGRGARNASMAMDAWHGSDDYWYGDGWDPYNWGSWNKGHKGKDGKGRKGKDAKGPKGKGK